LEWDKQDIHKYKPCDITRQNNKLLVKKRTLKQCQVRITLSEDPINTGNTLAEEYKHHRTTKNTKFNSIPSIDEIEREICICSDGGVKDNKPGVGIIASNKFKFNNEYNDINSYHCEGVGLLGAVKSFQNMLLYYNQIQEGKLVGALILCDNQSMVKVVNKYRYIKKQKKFYYESESEIIVEILETIQEIKKLGGEVRIKHIKGHQDKQQRPLSYHGFLNQQADQLATLAIKMRSSGRIVTPNTKTKLVLDNKYVSGKHSIIMKEKYHSIELRELLTDSNDWHPSILDDIWWQIQGKAVDNFSRGNRTALHKFIYKRWACNGKENQ
jgi:ribonuclease HI